MFVLIRLVWSNGIFEDMRLDHWPTLEELKRVSRLRFCRDDFVRADIAIG
jgi:hypothetical protein